MRPAVDLRSRLDHLRQSFVPLMGLGRSAFYPVKLRPCLGFTLTPRRKERPEPGSGRRDAAARKRERLASFLAAGGGAAGLVDGGYSDAPPQKTSKNPKGSMGLTRYGGRQVEEFCRLVRQDRGMYAIWTVTLPVPAAEALNSVDRGFAKFQDVIRRRFAEALGRACRRERGKVPTMPNWCYVVEPQTSGRPHLHFVFRSRSRMGRPWMLGTGVLDGLIQNAVRTVTGLCIEVPAAGNVQALRKDPGRYLSKYLRKGVGVNGAAAILGNGWSSNLVPSQWWGLSSTARAFLFRYTFDLPACLAAGLSLSWRDLAATKMLRGGIYQPPDPRAPGVITGSWASVERLEETIEWLVWLVEDAVGLACTFGIT